MEEISDKNGAQLVSLIYGTNMVSDYNENVRTVSDLVTKMEGSASALSNDENAGAEMTKKEMLDVIDQIKESKTLMRMEIKDFTNNKSTDFRAMTLVDPENIVKPVIVFRGTAGDGQWDDNLSAIFSSKTPSQKEAAAYVANSGLDHLTLAGHSKGGNMAASCAYLLPEGLIDKVYSYDGQGASQSFLRQIPLSKQEFAKNIVYNINEYRDPVSQLLAKMGLDKNSIYFDSGVNYNNADLRNKDFNALLYFCHVHKPNYYLKTEVKITNRTYVPSRLANTISMLNEIDAMPDYLKLLVAPKIAEGLHSKEQNDDSTKWSKEYWDCVMEAEAVYSSVNKSRESTLTDKLSALYNVKFSNFKLIQEDSSFVVEGAFLSCPYSSGIGDLKNIENHGNLIQQKPVASKRDNKPGVNIVMLNCQCSAKAPELLLNDGESEGVKTCAPEIFHDWVITDEDKVLFIGGEKVEAVLKKSVLGCCCGGIISVEHNGQMDLSDMKKLSLVEKAQKAVKDKQLLDSKIVRYTLAKARKIIDNKNPINKFKNKINDAVNSINFIFDTAEAAINFPKTPKTDKKSIIDQAMDQVNNQIGNVIRQMEAEKENFIWKNINSKIR